MCTINDCQFLAHAGGCTDTAPKVPILELTGELIFLVCFINMANCVVQSRYAHMHLEADQLAPFL